MPTKLNKKIRLSKKNLKNKKGGKLRTKKSKKNKKSGKRKTKNSIFNLIKYPDNPQHSLLIAQLKTEIKKNFKLVNKTDNLKNTLLHYAAKYGNVEAVQILIENGADVNKQNSSLQTPLHMSIPVPSYGVGGVFNSLRGNNNRDPNLDFDNKLKILNMLLNNKADLLIEDNEGDTAYVYAFSTIKGRKDFVDVLKPVMEKLKTKKR